MNTKQRKALDKYYTKPEVAELVWSDLKSFLSSINKQDYLVVEPSAGDGKMIDVVDCDKIGFDLVPESDSIIENDFLTGDIIEHLSKEAVFFGNPPFGKKGRLAIDFLNKSLQYGKTVGFIIPIQFKKYSVQKQINKDAKLVFERSLPDDSFLLNDKTYKVRCVFQIWTLENVNTNIREGKPVTTHTDFEMWQYNATEQALKYFDYDWDFCVLRQGYGDFNIKYRKEDAENLSRKKQWIFIKAKNKNVLKKLEAIDFNKLSELNTSTRGFGKHDLVKEYTKVTNGSSKRIQKNRKPNIRSSEDIGL
jgi:hypothetical protein